MAGSDYLLASDSGHSIVASIRFNDPDTLQYEKSPVFQSSVASFAPVASSLF
jgi:hypothetical protein